MITSLREIQLLKYLSDEECESLKAKAQFVRKKPGEAVALSGEPVAGIFIVVSGEVGVYPPGAKKPFSTLTPGMAFGEMSFLDGSKASATIRVEKEDTEIVCLSYSLLQQFVNDNPTLGANLYHGVAVSVAQKLRATNERISREVAATHKSLLVSKLAKAGDGAAAVESLSLQTAAQMKSLSQRIQSISVIASKLTTTIPEKSSELKAMGAELDEISSTVKNTLEDFKSQMNSLHHFVSVVERSIHH